jgi:hypothetical protein
MRQFDTGATRDTDVDKYDYEGFLHPSVLEAYAAYMHKNRVQADGKLRDSDNWQKGIPKDAYMKSMFRHFMDVWKAHRGVPGDNADMVENLSALLFNVMGYMYEELREERQRAEPTPFDGTYRPRDRVIIVAEEDTGGHYGNGDTGEVVRLSPRGYLWVYVDRMGEDHVMHPREVRLVSRG